jgi:hypothetical protein
VKLTLEDKAVQSYQAWSSKQSIKSVRIVEDTSNNFKYSTKINNSPHLEPEADRSLIIVTFSFYIIYRIRDMNVSKSIKEYL